MVAAAVANAPLVPRATESSVRARARRSAVAGGPGAAVADGKRRGRAGVAAVAAGRARRSDGAAGSAAARRALAVRHLGSAAVAAPPVKARAAQAAGAGRSRGHHGMVVQRRAPAALRRAADARVGLPHAPPPAMARRRDALPRVRALAGVVAQAVVVRPDAGSLPCAALPAAAQVDAAADRAGCSGCPSAPRAASGPAVPAIRHAAPRALSPSWRPTAARAGPPRVCPKLPPRPAPRPPARPRSAG